jgi:chemotaxis protein histidine kinase CheA
MSIEKIIAEAIDNNPLKLKEAFEDEMNARIRVALEEKYKEMTSEEEEVVAEETEELVEEDEEESDDDGEDEDEEDFDEGACVREMKKMHKDGEKKADIIKAVKEKYGCSEAKCNELYASNCG